VAVRAWWRSNAISPKQSPAANVLDDAPVANPPRLLDDHRRGEPAGRDTERGAPRSSRTWSEHRLVVQARQQREAGDVDQRVVAADDAERTIAAA
jgi:hypothetical protein